MSKVIPAVGEAPVPAPPVPRKPVPSGKVLICHPFWEGDRLLSEKLIRLLADLEPSRSGLADLLIVSRFDCAVDPALVNYASAKFDMHVHRSERKAVGWPAGCNAIFCGAVDWIYPRVATGVIPGYKAVIVLAADSAPLHPLWLELYRAAWDAENRVKKVCAAGALIPAGPHGHAHINGDCIMLSGEPEFLQWLTAEAPKGMRRAGWDWTLAHHFRKRGWADVSFVRSVWRKDSFSEADWDAEIARGTVLYHGVKNTDLLDLSRRKLLTK